MYSILQAIQNTDTVWSSTSECNLTPGKKNCLCKKISYRVYHSHARHVESLRPGYYGITITNKTITNNNCRVIIIYRAGTQLITVIPRPSCQRRNNQTVFFLNFLYNIKQIISLMCEHAYFRTVDREMTNNKCKF